MDDAMKRFNAASSQRHVERGEKLEQIKKLHKDFKVFIDAGESDDEVEEEPQIEQHNPPVTNNEVYQNDCSKFA